MALRSAYDFEQPVAPQESTRVAQPRRGVALRRADESAAEQRAAGLSGALQANREAAARGEGQQLQKLQPGEEYKPHVLQPVKDAAGVAASVLTPMTKDALDAARRGEREPVSAGEVAARFVGDVAPWVVGPAAGAAVNSGEVMTTVAVQNLVKNSASPRLVQWGKAELARRARNEAVAEGVASAATYEAGQIATGQSTPGGAAVTGGLAAAAGVAAPLVERLASRGFKIVRAATRTVAGGGAGAAAGYAATPEDATAAETAANMAMGAALGAEMGAKGDMAKRKIGVVAGKSPDLVTVYHRTTPENAEKILRTGKMVSRENTGEVFVGSAPDGEIRGYGDAVVAVQVPRTALVVDDAFPSGETHFRIDPSKIRSVKSGIPAKD